MGLRNGNGCVIYPHLNSIDHLNFFSLVRQRRLVLMPWFSQSVIRPEDWFSITAFCSYLLYLNFELLGSAVCVQNGVQSCALGTVSTICTRCQCKEKCKMRASTHSAVCLWFTTTKPPKSEDNTSILNFLSYWVTFFSYRVISNSPHTFILLLEMRLCRFECFFFMKSFLISKEMFWCAECSSQLNKLVFPWNRAQA